MAGNLTLEALHAAVAGGAVAVRLVQRLQPAGGAGDKVFPSTYEGGEYATETRVIAGQRVPCVVLDSVQSQANRIEQALKQACYRGRDVEAEIPIVAVDFGSAGLPEFGDITSLDAPHRLADAIFRDSMNAGIQFRESVEGKILDTAAISNAVGLYAICPSALLLGLWDSTGPRGGSGVKFQRALVSEIVGVDVQIGARSSSRIDPLGIERAAAEIYKAATGDGWTLDPAQAKQKDGKPEKYGKEGKPSEINHGNVTPSLKNDKGQPHPGGVSLSYAQHTVVLSVPALRRLSFPSANGTVDRGRDMAAHTALAALGIVGAHWSVAQGCDLRSRCLLVADPSTPANWEIVGQDGRATPFTVAEPMDLLRKANVAAKQAGLPDWRRKPLVLQPSDGLVELVKRSRALATASTVEA